MHERSNADWLTALRGTPDDEALLDLRELLVRGLGFALADRLGADPEASIEDFAQDALLKILRSLDTFRGESQFTTWAQKIAVRVALTELRRRRWRDVSLGAGAEFVYPVPQDDEVLAYVFEGAGQFGAEAKMVSAVSMVVFDAGDQVEVRAGSSGVRFMLMAGAPFREPIAPYGPFVMNTNEEIQRALYELRNGTFIKEEA